MCKIQRLKSATFDRSGSDTSRSSAGPVGGAGERGPAGPAVTQQARKVQPWTMVLATPDELIPGAPAGGADAHRLRSQDLLFRSPTKWSFRAPMR